MMNVIHEDGVHTAVYMTSSQVGKTEIINNVVGWCLDVDPYSMMVVQPKDDKAEEWSKERLKPMLRDTPRLRDKIDPRTESLLHKSFTGGFISIAGANSPANLAGKPLARVFLDEVDRYPQSAGKEGDPCDIVLRRTSNFSNKFHLLTSTPTIRRASRIEAAFNKSDQRRWYIACPCCDREQTLKFRNLKFTNHDPSTAVMQCEHCPAKLNNDQVKEAVLKGRWIAEKPENLLKNGIAGFHINAIYSPWTTLAEIVQLWLDAKDWPDRRKVFFNTVLGETYEEGGEAIDDQELQKHIEEYGGFQADKPDKRPLLPREVVLLTAGVDVHPDRLECETVGWAQGEECYGIQYRVFYGNPSRGEVWDRLEQHLLTEYDHESGVKLKIKCTMIDSGGHNTRNVYAFTKPREKYRMFATKGSNQLNNPIVGRFSKNNSHRAKIFIIGTDTAKDWIFGRLGIEEAGPGYCHFPRGFGYDPEYFLQLTGEKVVIKYKAGWPYRSWTKIRERNEALDVRVLAVAAFEYLKPNLRTKAKKLEQRAQSVKASENSATGPKPAESVEKTEVKTEAKQESGSEEIVSMVRSVAVKAQKPRKEARVGSFANSWKKL